MTLFVGLFLTRSVCMSPLSPLCPARDSPSPIDPESIQVPVTYDPDPADLALSSVPGQEMFDPRKRKFSAEELKPQPMIKKAKKVFVPDEQKVGGAASRQHGQSKLKFDAGGCGKSKAGVAAPRPVAVERLQTRRFALE